MFKHQGTSRTLKHNLKLATVLSFVAGIVNVTGFLAIKQLTTNVTGHFALFINDVSELNFWKGLIYFLYIFSFLFGSFLSSYLIEKFKQNKRLNIFLVPTIIESFILIMIAIQPIGVIDFSPHLIACLLLLAMGIQNSYVTKISNAVVRTTHLTGLFTDLGIDLSHLLFKRSKKLKLKTKEKIKLRIAIISSFFGGGLLGGYFFTEINLQLSTLFVAALILIISLIADDLRSRFH